MSKKPTHIAYAVREFQTSDGHSEANWTRIGAAWLHEDGKGHNITLDALPVSGRIVLRLNTPKSAET